MTLAIHSMQKIFSSGIKIHRLYVPHEINQEPFSDACSARGGILIMWIFFPKLHLQLLVMHSGAE